MVTSTASNYSNVEGLCEHGYEKMSWVEEALAIYLSRGAVSSLKAPVLPSKPCPMSSRPVGKAYLAAGQADGALHTVLQAFQADLLKDLDQGKRQSPEEDLELCRATDLALQSSKQLARTIGHSMAAMFATERHLWLNLSGIKKKENQN